MNLFYCSCIWFCLLFPLSLSAQFTGGSGDGYAMDELSVTLTGFENKEGLEQVIRVFPNPAVQGTSVFLTIAEAEATSIAIFSGQGKVLHQIDAERENSGKIVLTEVANLSQGVYHIQVRTLKGSKVIRLVVLR